jgi:hypothetical protein
MSEKKKKLRDLARKFCSCVEKGGKGEDELEAFRVCAFEILGKGAPKDRYAFPVPDESGASLSRTFTHVLFDVGRVMLKELQKRKNEVTFKKMHLFLKSQLTPWVVALGRNAKTSEDKKRVSTRFQFMYRLLWQGVTFILKNIVPKDIVSLMGAISWAFTYQIRAGQRPSESSIKRFRSAYERCGAVAQRDPKLRASSSVSMWACLRRCVREGKFSLCEGKENSNDHINTEWIDWILYSTSLVILSTKDISNDVLSMLKQCHSCSSSCQNLAVLAESMRVERTIKTKSCKFRMKDITKRIETMCCEKKKEETFRVMRMWKCVSRLVSVTRWDEVDDLIKALQIVSLKMLSSNKEDHTVRMLKFRAHALQVCAKRRDLNVDVLCKLSSFDTTISTASKDIIRSLNVIGSTMYNIGATLYNSSKWKESIRPFLMSCQVCMKVGGSKDDLLDRRFRMLSISMSKASSHHNDLNDVIFEMILSCKNSLSRHAYDALVLTGSKCVSRAAKAFSSSRNVSQFQGLLRALRDADTTTIPWIRDVLMETHENMQSILKDDDDVVTRSRDLQNQAIWYASQQMFTTTTFECDEDALRTAEHAVKLIRSSSSSSSMNLQNELAISLVTTQLVRRDLTKECEESLCIWESFLNDDSEKEDELAGDTSAFQRTLGDLCGICGRVDLQLRAYALVSRDLNRNFESLCDLSRVWCSGVGVVCESTNYLRRAERLLEEISDDAMLEKRKSSYMVEHANHLLESAVECADSEQRVRLCVCFSFQSNAHTSIYYMYLIQHTNK